MVAIVNCYILQILQIYLKVTHQQNNDNDGGFCSISGKPLKICKNVRPLDIYHLHPHGRLPGPSRDSFKWPGLINSLSTAYPQVINNLSTGNSQDLPKLKTGYQQLRNF